MRRWILSLSVLATVGYLAAAEGPVAAAGGAPSVPPGEGLAIEHAKLNTADASPVDPRHVELEFGYSGTWSRHAWDSDGDTHGRGSLREQALGLAVTVGVVPNLDVSIGLDYLWLHDSESDSATTGDDIGDLGVSGRYRFFSSEEHGIEAAWISDVTAPTGSRSDEHELGSSQEFWSWDNSLVIEKDWARWTMNAEVGWSQPFGEKRGDDRGTLIANLATGYQLLSWLQPVVELNCAREFVAAEDDESSVAVTAGLVMPISDCLRANLGIQQGVWGENTDRATTALLALTVGF
jgi:hypothetical protein